MKSTDVKKLRKRLKLSQAGLAKLLGCRSNTVYRWEAGLHPPSLGMAMLMAVEADKAALPNVR